ncbi:hypothetical protein, partial [Nostoc sp. 'Peltigera membranacea cyanobiont' 232]|uniref:hypothetical protein n=1 Tax=Nostoc sp. 'Peltigera membranacea cyanobiont' 232 TaxID=2014531 RepID=UPI000B9F85FB
LARLKKSISQTSKLFLPSKTFWATLHRYRFHFTASTKNSDRSQAPTAINALILVMLMQQGL